MASWWRGIALVMALVSTFGGCSDDDGAKPGSNASKGASGGTTLEAGAAGNGDVGGAETGGTAGSSASAGRGGSAGMNPVPAGWMCNYSAYGDGKCDCGCTVPDKDCSTQELAACEVCNGFGSCSPAPCPGRIDPDDVTSCPPVPSGWTCPAETFGDGSTCDCGCGIQDEDCADHELASCDRCDAGGSCAHGVCPSAISPDDNTTCEVPTRWTCEVPAYGDGHCDCGCGAVDSDCPDAKQASCEVCDSTSCSPFYCEVEEDDNAHCPAPPRQWECSPRLYRDGERCDCGCGVVDPDCESSAAESCDVCNDPGSCSGQPCPSFINAENNAACDQPTPPAEWACGALTYADGAECDCGCGVPDPDCRFSDVASCVRCYVCGGQGACEGTIDPDDSTQCAPPPPEWQCTTPQFRDLKCDCGCGIPDLACEFIELLYVCGNYPVEGCSGGNKSHVDPNHNHLCIISVPEEWTCNRAYYEDGLCDCGCGAPDRDCPSEDVSACDECDGDGSCSSAACPGSITEDDNAHCTG